MRSNLTQRIITGVVAGSLALACILWNFYSFTALIALVVIIATCEWLKLIPNLAGNSVSAKYTLLLAGIPYIGLCALSLLWLRAQDGDTAIPYITLGCFALVWITDIAAYAFGRTIGGPKVAPSISPNKTWAGSTGAIASCAVFAWFATSSLILVGAAIAVSMVSQAGDFFESWLKRKAGVKDSGAVLPGHGGMLDRIDGLLFAAPLYSFIYLLQ